jgi:CIC family chloride channel protein
VLGAVIGLVAVAYNRALLATTAAFEHLALPVEARAALIGAAVGALGWVYPGVVGGGDAITQGALTGGQGLQLVALVFLIRFGLGAVSYSAATPGGLFAPLLALGALFGLVFAATWRWAFPALDVPAQSFALVGMAAFFAGVVRAPLTGMVFVSEMTGNVTLLLQMLGACATAMLVPALLRNPPIYDSLRKDMLRRARDGATRTVAIAASAAGEDSAGPGATWV